MASRYLLESGTPDGYTLEQGGGVLIMQDADMEAALSTISPAPAFAVDSVDNETSPPLSGNASVFTPGDIDNEAAAALTNTNASVTVNIQDLDNETNQAITTNVGVVSIETLALESDLAITGITFTVEGGDIAGSSGAPVTVSIGDSPIQTTGAIGSVFGSADLAVGGVHTTGSAGTVVGIPPLILPAGEYRHVAVAPIGRQRSMRLKDLERIYQKWERKL